MKPYVVKQGDYLTKLAHTRGFSTDEVWNHAKNAELKRARKDPNVLRAGDVIFVPDAPKKKLPVSVAAENTYSAKVPKVKVNVAFAEAGEPLAGEKYRLEGLGDDEERKTDAEGRVAFEAPVHVREVVVFFVERGTRVRVGVGDLDPADTPSGIRMRLTSLGFYGGKVAGEDPHVAHEDSALAAAVSAFQATHGLNADGVVDDATRDAIVAAHGS